MTDRVTKRSRMLVLTALLIVAFGVAATPVRNAWAPLVARPFAHWIDQAPAAVVDVETQPVQPLSTRTGRAPEPDVPLVAALAPAPDTLASSGRTMVDGRAQSREAYGSTGWSAGLAFRRGEGGGAASGSRYAGGGSGFGGTGAASASGGADRRDASTANAHVDSTGASDTKKGVVSAPVPAPSSPPAPPSAPPSAGTAPAAPAPGSDPGRSPQSGEKPKGSDSLFGEHTAGLGDLTGKTGSNLPLDGGAYGSTNVAVNPEPSTLLLFGTGIIAAAGAIRRRLR